MDKPKDKKFKKFASTSAASEQIQVIKPITSTSDRRISDDWNYYLPDQSFQEFAQFNGQLKAIEKFFSETDINSLTLFCKNQYFKINVANILKDKPFLSNWPDFMNDLINSPNIVIGLFGFSMDQLIKKQNIKIDEDDDFPIDNEVLPIKIKPRFVGLQNYMSFKDLKLETYGKFVTVIGTVIHVSDIKPFCICIAFMCVKCKTVQVVVQNKGCYTMPNTCSGNGCFGKVFKPILDSHLTQTVPLKTIRLQALGTDSCEGGPSIPRTMECELTCDLTNSCIPRDKVIISGIVTTCNSTQSKRIGKTKTSYLLHISANSVCLKDKNADNMDLTTGLFELKSEDLGTIQKIHSEKNLFRLVVSSLAPNIYGHELIKAGLVLGLFGGQDRTNNDEMKKEYTIRENSHILIIGDPGLGKSEMLLACSNVSPRGVYVCGTAATSSGLTVTVSKEKGRGTSLEAGALVLADRGHCCIDEFDKMKRQHSALLEAMEQQTISVAKSGVVCSLPARTTILAAGNPSGGHYNKAKTFSENVKIGGALLSRFDLVFILQDEPDPDFDDKMCDHILGLNKMNESGENVKSSISAYCTPKDTFQGSNPVLKKLKLKSNEKLNLIPHTMLQKYISYARKYSQPKITPEVAKILQEFFLDMRKRHKLSHSNRITIRQLEALIRLTKARARVELRTFCTTNDAEDVIEIMKYTLRETYSDEFGNIDFDRSIHRSGMSKSKQAKELIKSMTRVAETRGDDCFTKDEIQQLGSKLKLSSDSLYVVIEKLNDQGFLLKKGHNLYKLQTL